MTRLHNFLRWLARHELEFHLDDDPADISWSRELTEDERRHIDTEHKWIWANHTSAEIWRAVGELWTIA